MNTPPFGIPNLKSAIRRAARPGALLAMVLVAELFAGVSCRKPGPGAKPEDVDYYTCAMHPSVKLQDPKARCPICSMDLVSVKKRSATAGEPAVGQPGHDHARMLAEQTAGKGQPSSGHAAQGAGAPLAGATAEARPGEFMVPVARQQQIGVTYTAVERKPLRLTIRAVGRVAYDKQRHWDYVARVEGYVQKLEVTARGQVVAKDQPLLTIYSPELLTTQREFVDLARLRDEARKTGGEAVLASAERLLESAQRRLRLWNISDQQIAELERTREARESLTFYSPFKGVIQDLPVDQGRRVMPGDRLVDVADLSGVWVWAEFYQDELPLLKNGLPVTVSTASYPGEKFTGTIDLIDPFLDDARRTGRARFTLPNPDLKLRPEMYVDVELTMDMGEGVVVPVNAVIPTGKRNVVFVDKGEGWLEPRFVELSRKYGDFYEVKSGLTETERVVTSANFLIDAEAKVQGALKSW